MEKPTAGGDQQIYNMFDPLAVFYPLVIPMTFLKITFIRSIRAIRVQSF